MRKGMIYPHNVIQSFDNGANLDLRVRLAIQFLQSPAFTHQELSAKEAACFALDVAEEITLQGEERGWIEAFATGPELPEDLTMQAERTARFQVEQQLRGNRYAADQANKVVPAAPSVIKKH